MPEMCLLLLFILGPPLGSSAEVHLPSSAPPGHGLTSCYPVEAAFPATWTPSLANVWWAVGSVPILDLLVKSQENHSIIDWFELKEP